MEVFVLSLKNPFANPSASSNRLLGLLRGLSKLDNEVTLFVLGGYYTESEILEFSDYGVKDNITYYYLSKRKNINIWQRRATEYFFKFLSIFFLFRKLKKIVNTTSKNKIVWIENEYLSFRLVPKLKRINNVKLFIEINEYPDIHISNTSTKYFWQTRKANKQVNYLFSRVLPELNGIALMTNSLIEYFNSRIRPNTKVLHLPMTVDLDRFDLANTYDPIDGLDTPFICFVGSMNDAKDGVNILIEAFSLISNEFPNYKLALFGFWAYDTPNHLQRIKQLGIQDKVIYSKPINPDKVVNLIMNANVLVLSRPDSYQAKGGFPTKLGEYLATSKPVIATKVGEIPNYLENNSSAFLIEPNSILSLSDTLRIVLSDPINSKRVGLNGRKVAEKYFSATLNSKKLNDFLIDL